jgi:hypothetical protein
MSEEGGPIIIIHPHSVEIPKSALEEVLAALATDSPLKAEIEAKLAEAAQE